MGPPFVLRSMVRIFQHFGKWKLSGEGMLPTQRSEEETKSRARCKNILGGLLVFN